MGLLLFTGWQLSAGGLVLVPVLLLFEGLPSQITGTNATGFLYLIVLGSLFGYSIWFRGVERLPAVAVSFLGLLSPIVATILGYVFLGQSLSFLQAVGALIIVGSILFAQLIPVEKRTAAPVSVPEVPTAAR